MTIEIPIFITREHAIELLSWYNNEQQMENNPEMQIDNCYQVQKINLKDYFSLEYVKIDRKLLNILNQTSDELFHRYLKAGRERFVVIWKKEQLLQIADKK